MSLSHDGDMMVPFPLEFACAHTLSSKSNLAGETGRGIVLMVGGHHTIWGMVAAALQLKGYASVEKKNVGEALAWVESTARTESYPVAVLLDSLSAGNSTSALVQQILADWPHAYPVPPLISLEDGFCKRLEYSHHFSLRKPFHLGDLFALIRGGPPGM